jgi:sugar/nucleoside kinase (ribokinase family)
VNKVLVVGSVGYDTIETARGRRDDILGGSAVYFSLAARLFAPVAIVGVVGEDFRQSDVGLLKNAGIDTACLETVPGGKTFRWHGKYHADMNARDTVSVSLNVLGGFKPQLPKTHVKTPFVFLANGSTEMQLSVLGQVGAAKSKVYFDTMDLWINTSRDGVIELLRRTDGVVLNDSEALALSGKSGIVAAGRELIKMGGKCVIIKKGEHGSIAFTGDKTLLVPAYPLEEVFDPTGAGDSYAGALTGALAAGKNLHDAMMAASVTASFTCESFGIERLLTLNMKDVNERLKVLKAMICE